IDSSITGVVLSVESGDTNLVLASDVFFDAATTGSDRNFRVAPKGAASGTTTLRFFATDAETGKSAAFDVPLDVVAQTDRKVVANATSVAIADGPNGTNKVEVVVSDLKANLGKVLATLANLSHTRPEDLD